MTRQIAAAALALWLVPSSLFAQTPPDAARLHFMVDSMSANIHMSPSVGSAVVGRAPRGRSLEIMRELGDWVKVTWPETPEGFGYVHVTMGRIMNGRGGARPSGAPGSASTGSGSRATWSPWPSTPPAVDNVVATPAESPRAVYIAPPTHFVGLGGRMSGTTLGYGVTGRAWSRGALGAQVDLSRIAQTTPGLPGRMTSLQFSPSVLYGFADFVSDSMWLRPYVGGGGSLQRHTMSGITPEASVTENKFSFQGFGGVEVTLPSMPRFALSVDAGYDSAKTPFDGFEVGGIGFSISGRWYFK
jgi:hypothetical protein